VCVLFAYFFGFLSFSVAVAESRWRYWCLGGVVSV